MSEACPFGEIVVNPYKEKESENREGLLAKGVWTPETTTFVRARGIQALYLNVSKGWKGTDYSFLLALPDLQELDIIAAEAKGLGCLGELKGLRRLSLSAPTREPLDVSGLTSLRRAFFLWWSGLKGLPTLKGLKHLHLDQPSAAFCSELGGLTGLESLTLGNTPLTDVSFLRALRSLKKLELLNCRKLSDFSPVSECRGLTSLRIEGSKGLTNLAALTDLRQLEILLLSDNKDIASLGPMAGLVNLKAFAFPGGTNIVDGDLEPLEKLPRLAMLMFAPRKHYTHKLIKPWNWKNFDQPDRLLERKA